MRGRLILPALACCVALMTGCVPTSDEPADATQQGTFTSPSIAAVLPSRDTSASMDALVSGIAARKAAEAAKARAIAQAKAKALAEAQAKREAREAALASQYSGTRRYVAAKPKKHELTEAEKAAAMKALAIKKLKETPPPVVVIFR